MFKSTALRDADFLRRARQVIRREHERGVRPTLRRVAILTVFGGADNFHASHKYLCNQIYHYLRLPEDERPCLQTARLTLLRMLHILERVKLLLLRHPEMPLTDAVSLTLNSRAPRFYISVENAIDILRRGGVEGCATTSRRWNDRLAASRRVWDPETGRDILKPVPERGTAV